MDRDDGRPWWRRRGRRLSGLIARQRSRPAGNARRSQRRYRRRLHQRRVSAARYYVRERCLRLSRWRPNADASDRATRRSGRGGRGGPSWVCRSDGFWETRGRGRGLDGRRPGALPGRGAWGDCAPRRPPTAARETARGPVPPCRASGRYRRRDRAGGRGIRSICGARWAIGLGAVVCGGRAGSRCGRGGICRSRL